MKMSDLIADFIGEMLLDGGGVAELQRKTLADRFCCVPSQINYVIETRFTPENGYWLSHNEAEAVIFGSYALWMTAEECCSMPHAVLAAD